MCRRLAWMATTYCGSRARTPEGCLGRRLAQRIPPRTRPARARPILDAAGVRERRSVSTWLAQRSGRYTAPRAYTCRPRRPTASRRAQMPRFHVAGLPIQRAAEPLGGDRSRPGDRRRADAGRAIRVRAGPVRDARADGRGEADPAADERFVLCGRPVRVRVLHP